MSMKETLAKLFPSGTVNLVKADEPLARFEVKDLPKDSAPQNCEILEYGCETLHQKPQARRDHYLVKADGLTLFFRICSGDQASEGHDEYAAGQGCTGNHEKAQQLEAYAKEAISHLCMG